MVETARRGRGTRRNGAPAPVTDAPDTASTEDAYLFTPRFMPPRQYVNPIRGLTPARAVQMLENAVYGYKADLQWTYKSVERKEPVLRALKERRLSAIKKLKWVIRVKDEAHSDNRNGKSDPARDAEVEVQTEVLQEVYGRIKNLKDAIRFMALATFRGYSHLEKHVDEEGWLCRLEPVPQWYWAQCYPISDWLFNVQALQINAGQAIDPDAWVVREVEDPLDEIAIILFLRKNLSKKDWDAFVETFGVPSLFTKFEKDSVRPNDMAGYLDIINKVLSAGRGALPHGVDITSTSAMIGSSATHPFQPHLDYCNFELVLAGTGGKLTMLSDATGIGAGASPAHEEVFKDIAEGEGEEICELLRSQIDEPELKRRGFDRPLVEFALEVMKPEDKEKNAQILGSIAAAGYRTTDEQASEMLEMEVHSVMGPPGGDMFGGDEGEVDENGQPLHEAGPGAAEDGVAGKTTWDEGGASSGGSEASNRKYFDAPGDNPPAAPFAEAMRTHDGQVELAEKYDRMTRPYAEQSEVRSEANPDPPQIMTTYPTAEGQDRYVATMRKALKRYQKSFARGVSKDLESLRAKVREIIALDKPELVAEKLQQLRQQLPKYLSEAVKDSAAAKAMEAALTESIERGAKLKR